MKLFVHVNEKKTGLWEMVNEYKKQDELHVYLTKKQVDFLQKEGDVIVALYIWGQEAFLHRKDAFMSEIEDDGGQPWVVRCMGKCGCGDEIKTFMGGLFFNGTALRDAMKGNE